MRTLCVLLWKDLMMAKRQKRNVFLRIVSPLIFTALAMYFEFFNPEIYNINISLKEYKILDYKTPAPRCILYTPKSYLAGTLMKEVGRQLGLSRLTGMPHRSPCNGYYPYSNYFEIDELVKTFDKNEVLMHFIFEDMDAKSWSSRQKDTLTYTIRMYGKYYMSSITSSGVVLPPDLPHNGNIYENFMHIQRVIHTSYFIVRTRRRVPQKLFVQRFAHFRRNFDRKRLLTKIVFAILYYYTVTLSAIFIFTHIVARMLCERADGIQELIKMNGVSQSTMGIAYFINSIPPVLSLSIGGSILVKAGKAPLIEYTSRFYIFVALALYAVSIIAFGMACSYVANKSQNATMMATFIYIATLLVTHAFMRRAPKIWILKMLSGMVWHMPLSWILTEILIFEAFKKPFTMSDLNSTLNENGSVLEGYICLILQSLIYFALTWYLSHVRQGVYGNSLPWNFPCKKKVDDSAIAAAHREPPKERDDRYFEEPPRDMPVGIQIVNVSKYYQKPALRDVSLNVYKGEITVLLGHNGAGKTTLMSIITGMTQASKGKVFVNGLETSSHGLQVRKQMGLCTQHNQFMDHINVIEHVMFFNKLKGKSKNPRAASEELLNKLGIGNKASADPKELSGGMKRRLQLACALAGGSDVLVLDEPTSGLDVETRRELWNLLLSLRGEHTVLLSTHFMEEADALGDRVAALQSGHLRCHATPMYLKKAMGGGYRLSLITSGQPNEAKITALVTQHVSSATVREQSMNTIIYNLPSTATPQFPALFTALETNRSALNINSIGVGVTSMEDVFLFLCSDSTTITKEESDTEVPASEYGKMKGKVLYKRIAIALLKRHINFHKDSKITFPILHIIVPALFIYLLAFNGVQGNLKITTSMNEPNVSMSSDLDMYKPLPDRMAPHSTVYRHAATEAFNLLSNAIAPQFRLPAKRAITKKTRLRDRRQASPPPNGAKDSFDCVLWGTFVGAVILFTSFNLQALPAREGVSGTRHLHVMAGCPAALHWLCTLAIHTALTLLIIVPITIICVYAGDEDNTFRNARFLLILALILILGQIACFGFMYFLTVSSEFTTYSSVAIGVISWSGLFTAVEMSPYVLEGVQFGVLDYILLYITHVLPPFSMMTSMAQAAYVARLNALCELHKNRCPNMLLEDKGFDEAKCCAGESAAFVSFEVFAPGRQLLLLLVQGIVYMTLVILVQMGYGSCFGDKVYNKWGGKFKPQPLTHVDELVAAEATLVDQEIELPEQEIVNHNKAMLVSHLHKNFIVGENLMLHAVQGISFSVKKGECFGLLGLNGAGKSTTFKMMTTEVCPTSGRIFANGVFLHKQKKEFLRKIGYCPQFLGIDEFQTGSNNLKTLLTIRGLDDKDIDKEIKAWIAVVGLQKYENMKASRYSGGYKRRLAAATALCSRAPLSLLDEPTAGVDVGARRLVHAALRQALSLGNSIVITSHSMDEMETLCTRIAIMAGGKIRALGTSAELRTKYAQGYALKLKIKPSHDGESGGKSAVDNVKEAVAAKFNCVLKDEHRTMLHYHITDQMKYSDIFSKLEDLRMQFSDVIEDYSVSETTLEEVFLHFAKEHQIEKQAAEEAELEAERNKKKPNSKV